MSRRDSNWIGLKILSAGISFFMVFSPGKNMTNGIAPNKWNTNG
jgi:hypothetical protein